MTLIVNKLTDLLKVSDHAVVNETIIALQNIVNHGSSDDVTATGPALMDSQL